MMNFKGCSCSVCGQPFQPGDDIVVCPECGAPYHRACYAKEGHCVYEAQHGNGFEYQPPAPVGGSNRCGNCGANNPQGNLFCENCGAALGEHAARSSAQQAASPMRTQPAQSPMGAQSPFRPAGGAENPMQGMFDAAVIGREYDGISSADWGQYIGKSAPYYLYQFSHMDETGRKSSVCWSALFFAPFYFAYRKMWGWLTVSAVGALIVSIPSFLDILQRLGIGIGFTLSGGALGFLTIACAVLNWTMSVFFGIFAFYLFRQHSAKKLHALKQRAADPAEYQTALARRGGPSAVAAALLGVACVLLCYAFVFWVGPDKIIALSNSLYY
ncbi:MAG: RING finger protein [Ruthenibacterium sp.]